MSTPILETEQYSFPAFSTDTQHNHHQESSRQEHRSSDEDGTLRGEHPYDDNHDHHDHHHNHHHEQEMDNNHLRVATSFTNDLEHLSKRSQSPLSAAAQREQSRRLDDDLEMLRVERVISIEEKEDTHSMGKSLISRSRGGGAEPIDDFDVNTTPIHEKTKIYRPPAHPATKLAKFFKKVHGSSILVRYFVYITPVMLLLLIPLLFGLLLFENTTVGGVKLFWFGIWLEIVWLTLWLARIIAKCIPYPMGLISSLFTNNDKKWRDLGKSLEVPATLFFWWLAIEISFLPTMKNHHLDGNKTTRDWELTCNKIIVSVFVGATLNFIEKIIIQLIAISFHLRTYSDRIELNKFQIQSLVKLYKYSKEKIQELDADFEDHSAQAGVRSGARTPMLYVNKAQKNARNVFTKVGDVAGKVAGDFTGRAVTSSTHPHQVILQLLNTTTGSQVLARRLYRTFVHDNSDTILAEDLTLAFDNEEEAEAAFTMFDKDLNGDISMEELETVCVEIGRERKAITASLKDLDSVVSKLDNILLFIVVVITVLVFISLISTSASGVLTSAGSSVLALSWLFTATAQEFLQSIIFVFVKHPFDVGDRVTIYGNTGSKLQGDDYFVKEISLLFTEFKKMEGHVVQAPNSYLNTLFILNQRRSGGLAEAVPITVKFGTSIEQLEQLREELVKFVQTEKREYQGKIITEVTTIYENYSITFNVVFFYKSSWQNELLRLQRRNKFIIAMICAMEDLGIQGPRQRLAGFAQENPVYFNGAYPPPYQPNPEQSEFGPGPRSGSLARDQGPMGEYEPQTGPQNTSGVNPHPSILRRRTSTSQSNARRRGESLSAMNKRVDFSLGMQGMASGMDLGDVFDDRPKPRIPIPDVTLTSASPGAPSRRSRDTQSRDQEESLARQSTQDSSSRGAQLNEVTSSNSGRAKTHLNRFFSRRGKATAGNYNYNYRDSNSMDEEGTNLDELEAGLNMHSHSRDIHSSELRDIPEASGSTTANVSPGSGYGHGVAAGTSGRIDPRSGMVSSRAVE
ncbi:59b63122-6f05-4088-be6c-8e8ce4aaccde [Sclerotinia trifoliorum]|uniref:Mechanosensitive ion channel protein n=1 Tax=Sclerotinia trifoliorum TaxID=28548 RepID=A0A8H2ZRZ8_9HELO|nr:59b63122-6f05-4088-be6c-8e8ce4aaccde [Sclerotinia trifoliorum]